jgi:hypothetical protein
MSSSEVQLTGVRATCEGGPLDGANALVPWTGPDGPVFGGATMSVVLDGATYSYQLVPPSAGSAFATFVYAGTTQ